MKKLLEINRDPKIVFGFWVGFTWGIILMLCFQKGTAQTCLIVPKNAGYFYVPPVRYKPQPPCDSTCMEMKREKEAKKAKEFCNSAKEFGVIFIYVGLVFVALFMGAKMFRIFAILVLFSCSSYAQTPQLHAKGDTIVAPCDSFVCLPASRLRAALLFERNKNAALVKLGYDKDAAVKALIKTYEERIHNYNKQAEALEAANKATTDTLRKALYESRINTEQVKGAVTLLQYQLKKERDDRELEAAAAKGLLLRRSLVWGSVGVGVGGILMALIFVAK